MIVVEAAPQVLGGFSYPTRLWLLPPVWGFTAFPCLYLSKFA
jgi:hypothetical protein